MKSKTETALEEELQKPEYAPLASCRLCPRSCGANRLTGRGGACRSGALASVSRASLHLWEEPCISGSRGSGTVFFTGCPLGCCYCQNAAIAHASTAPTAKPMADTPAAPAAKPMAHTPAAPAAASVEVTQQQLAELFLRLQEKGAANINLVTAGHFVIPVRGALQMAKQQGLHLPIVYNTSGYEKPETLQLLEGLVDIYLPDFKYWSSQTAGAYSAAPDYPERAKEALCEMVRQCPRPEFDAEGMMRQGVIVRLLLLPGHVKEACRIVDYLHSTFRNRIYISLMSQYTPMPAMREDHLLSRCVTKREYEKLIRYATDLGVENGFIQEGGAAAESFIPEFNGEGVLH